MITALPTEAYPQLIDLIQETEQIDSILSAGIDEDGVIFCLALDGDEQISVKIGDQIETRSFNAEAQTVKMAAPTPDLVDVYVERMTDDDYFKPWLKQAQELLMQSSDLNDFSDKLDSLYPDLSSVEFGEAMRGALTSASMGGYYQAQQEKE